MHRRTQLSTRQTVAPFAIAAACGTIVCLALGLPLAAHWRAGLVGVFGATLVFDLPVCFLILIGHPPVISLAPLILSREQRALRRALRERPALDDAAFYEAYYRESGIPAEIPCRIRRGLEHAAGLDLDGIAPSDNIALLDDELDFADVFYRLEKVFRITIPRDRWHEVNGSFDSVVQLVANSSGGLGA